ncbi:fungal-specific transcription factor domain-domain-containing protein [Kockovaella imperatae]|uniref:Fungal-specific transcription factor domain-domain-containing protein n=1 Tax=Kockovaella imperatae TaxID=4999 RepID=A0A1Y1UHC8_9TREE|nr:fungal-specific transcription factor domain-domain-containing protein [Kockovaella imperatae]ORX37458.1 fungal-specific transcription factor domain-domain-containing protein [Kockovaella imperatae]
MRHPSLLVHTHSNAVKRTLSCDLCRVRKVKCVKTGQSKCQGCLGLNRECEFTHVRKKPGPVNKFARPSQQSHQPLSTAHPAAHLLTTTHFAPWESPLLTPVHQPLSAPPIMFNHSSMPASQFHENPYLPFSASLLLPEGDQSRHDVPTRLNTGASASCLDAHAHIAPMLLEDGRMYSLSPRAYRSPNTIDDSSMWAVSDPRPRLEDIVSWDVARRILDEYHLHLFPLMPIVHWPTFNQQLENRVDEHSGVFRAFLFSLISYSVIQLPRSTLGFLNVEHLRRLHQECHRASQVLRNRDYKHVTLVDIQTLYCDHVYLGSLGDQSASVVAQAKAAALSSLLNLNDEEKWPQEMTSPVEREVRRRVFWLMYGSDRTDTALANGPFFIPDEELNISLPLAVDDQALQTSPTDEFQPQVSSSNQTSILAGFHYNSRLFRLLGSILSALKSINASWRDPSMDPYPCLNLPVIEQVYRPSSHFHEALEQLLDDLPGPLRLANLAQRDSDLQLGPERETAEQTAYANCRANLLITQAMTRFAIRKYAKAIGDLDVEGDCSDWAERDVLSLLERMSPTSLAANGNAMRVKLLFVTSSLMEKYPVNTDGHNYVADFLNVYTRAAEERRLAILDEERHVGQTADPGKHR